ncbi:DUF2812 domain-containing protein [Bacillaceae bacterium IKA-2]|nr:DUF2812 domain-containing protein [Bacillaceae bacterium IKA-2]
MNKTTNMLRPTDFWRIGEHESWFSDMAQEGLHLKKVGLQFVKFTKGKPKMMKYRIDVSQGKKITPEQKEMYSESGWNYVTSYGEFNVFSSSVEANSPELHTDPAEQAYTLNYLDKKLSKTAFVVAVAVLLMIGMLVSIWFFNSANYIALVDGSFIQQSILIIVELYVAYTSLQAAISIRALRKTLSEGKPINHSAPWKRIRKVKLIIASLYIILAIFGAILPIMQLAMNETKTLPVAGTDLPIVRLADIEQNPKLNRGEASSYIRDNVDWGNRYTYNWSLLAPVHYESNENGIVSNEMWKDGSGVYSPSIETRVYQLSLPSIAESLISDLIKRYGLAYRGGDFIEIEHTYFDILIVHEVDEFKEVFAAKGKAVMHVRYHGYAKIDSIIGATAEKITLISD